MNDKFKENIESTVIDFFENSAFKRNIVNHNLRTFRHFYTKDDLLYLSSLLNITRPNLFDYKLDYSSYSTLKSSSLPKDFIFFLKYLFLSLIHI